MTKRFGFTLAEVLITLGIIGVVAAMTMPSLINSTNGAQYKAAYKKALSSISQAIVLNIALDDWGTAETDKISVTAGEKSLYNLFKTRMNVVKTSTAAITGYTIAQASDGGTFGTGASNYSLFLNDGIMLSFPNSVTGGQACTEAAPCKGYVDVNGLKGPNKVTVCSDGKTKNASCEVTNPADVYAVRFQDQSIMPNSDAARAVLYGK